MMRGEGPDNRARLSGGRRKFPTGFVPARDFFATNAGIKPGKKPPGVAVLVTCIATLVNEG
jgi:hypothetical protein